MQRWHRYTGTIPSMVTEAHGVTHVTSFAAELCLGFHRLDAFLEVRHEVFDASRRDHCTALLHCLRLTVTVTRDDVRQSAGECAVLPWWGYDNSWKIIWDVNIS